MSIWEFITVCVSLVVGLTGIATIFAGAYVKAHHLDEIKDGLEKAQVYFRNELDKMWTEVTKVGILDSKLEGLENRMEEVISILRDMSKRA